MKPYRAGPRPLHSPLIPVIMPWATPVHTVYETGQQAEQRGRQLAHTHPADQVMHSVTPEQRLLGR